MSQPRTQIIITGINKDLFTAKWPESLKVKIFDEAFPQYKNKVSYFTSLPFLNRLVIILDDEITAKQIYDYLQPIVSGKELTGMKLFLTESLLLPRSRSFDDTDNISPLRKGSITESLLDSGKPILSLDTNPLTTGVNATSLSVGSPSLSPETSNVDSPTLLKFSNDSKPYYYREPLPQSASQLNLTSSNDNCISPSNSSSTTQISTDSPMNDKKAHFLRVDTGSNVTNGNINDDLSTPKSPSITINQFVQ
ncbi:hypothetical protein C6P45_001217 [Maudiozyma exigua]|uniref:Uncharacterized protein n=1 Tax=Maudiozyma exigua TaxID=34358 RepID=A0A9P7B759_MAUEX|nr:hypothetical protein C6P45_001217 [Kazachstania exigua]